MTAISLGNHSIAIGKRIKTSLTINDFTIDYSDYIGALTGAKLTSELMSQLTNIVWDTEEAKLNRWTVTDKGKYVGAWAKRFAKYIKATKNIKVDPTSVSIISERIKAMAAPFLNPIELEFVTKADWKAGEFGESTNSCWFPGGSWDWARKNLIEQGGGAILVYDSNGGKRSRCWWYPVRPNNLALFNAYDKKGTLTLLGYSRLLSSLYGVNYKMHTNVYAGEAYVNGLRMYMVGSPVVTRPVSLLFGFRKMLNMETETAPTRTVRDVQGNLRSSGDCIIYEDSAGNQGYVYGGNVGCYECGTSVGEDTHQFDEGNCIVDGRLYCESCIEDHSSCRDCDAIIYPHQEDDSIVLSDGSRICSGCRNDYLFCERCENYVHDNQSVYLELEEESICDGCYSTHGETCDDCDKSGYIGNMKSTGYDAYLCERCAEAHSTCDNCGELQPNNWESTTVIVAYESTEEWCEKCDDIHSCSICGDIVANAYDEWHMNESHNEEEEE